MKRHVVLSLLVWPVLGMLSGCLINSAKVQTVEPDAKRLTVDFESAEGLELFHEHVQRDYNRGGAKVGTDVFAIPFIIGASTTRVLSENAYYNQQVEKADVNGDGQLDDVEVRAFVNAR